MKDIYRLQYHLMPDHGWVNDPNGLIQSDGVYHICYQYSPDVLNGEKFWKEFTSTDLIHYKDEGIVLSPDHPRDSDGVYSGCCIKEGETFYYFYTGNVKHAGNYDYINAGREHNTMLATSTDGVHIDHKEVLLTNEDYPKNMSCHVRDPYVYQFKNTYYMALGARTKDSIGCVLLYQASDLHHWHYLKTITTSQPFGYMWECPNYLTIDGDRFLVCCPQGLDTKGYDYEAIYQNGYFKVTGDLSETCSLSPFKELDHGFDFYAPQIFADEKNRHVMLGWMGLPDVDYTNPTVASSWQHAMTMFRELTNRNGELYQYPLSDYEALRKHQQLTHGTILDLDTRCFELQIQTLPTSFHLEVRGITMDYNEGVFTLDMKDSGSGRKQMHIEAPAINELSLFSDTSSLEIFINHGQYALTTRIYETNEKIRFVSDQAVDMTCYELDSIKII